MSDEPLGTNVGGHGFIGQGTDDHDEDGNVISQWWSIGRLWRIADTLPFEDVPLAQLGDVLDGPSNFVASLGENPMCNRDVAEKARRIWNADLSYPVIVAQEGWLMDGCHRIMKTYALGLPTVRVVRFAANPPPDRLCSAAAFAKGGMTTF